MKNGHLETWQVVRWLGKHPRHTAEAPEANGMYASKAYASTRILLFEYHVDGIWKGDAAPYQRSDWTIRNERGRKVRFKKRAKLIRTGELNRGERLEVHDAEWAYYKRELTYAAETNYRVLLQEVLP